MSQEMLQRALSMVYRLYSNKGSWAETNRCTRFAPGFTFNDGLEEALLSNLKLPTVSCNVAHVIMSQRCVVEMIWDGTTRPEGTVELRQPPPHNSNWMLLCAMASNQLDDDQYGWFDEEDTAEGDDGDGCSDDGRNSLSTYSSHHGAMSTLSIASAEREHQSSLGETKAMSGEIMIQLNLVTRCFLDGGSNVAWTWGVRGG